MVALVLLPAPVLAQATRAGIVTALQGHATVAHLASKQPAPLKFRDDVFLNDRITTGDRSLARVLLGGRATVTVRERSILAITAAPGTATLDLPHGKLALAVARDAMKPGESIEIRTPNIVVAIRGTVVVAEVSPGRATDGTLDVTVFTVLRGTVEVLQLDAVSRRPLGPPLTLGALQSITVTGSAPPQLRTITPEAAQKIANDYRTPPAPVATAAVAESEAQKAASRVDALVRGLAPDLSGTTTPVTSTSGALSTSTSGLTSTTSGTLSTTSGTLSSTTSSVFSKTSGVLNTTTSGLGTPTLPLR
jgi:hypothetical protein